MTCTRSTRTNAPESSCRTRAFGRAKLLLAAVAVTFGILALTGCKDDVAGPGSSSLVGDYELNHVKEKAIPATFTDAAGSTLSIFGGTMEMAADGEFVYNIRGRINSYNFDYDDWGTYKISGKKVSFNVDSDDPSDDFTGTISGNQIIIDYPVAGVKMAMRLDKK